MKYRTTSQYTTTNIYNQIPAFITPHRWLTKPFGTRLPQHPGEHDVSAVLRSVNEKERPVPLERMLVGIIGLQLTCS